jgi:hypothetical protein
MVTVVALVDGSLSEVEDTKEAAEVVEEGVTVVVSMDTVEVASIVEVVAAGNVDLDDTLICSFGISPVLNLDLFASPVVDLDKCSYARIP